MGQLGPKLRVGEGGRLVFWCPGCLESHMVTMGRWNWNGSISQPTFDPSVLVTSGHYMPGHQGPCWCTYNREHPDSPAPFRCQRCHSYVRGGQIQFLTDSTHGLAGRTVELPDLPPHLQG